MAWIEAGGKSFDVDLVVFDKDGTMVDFDLLWAGKMRRAILRLSSDAQLSAEDQARLLRLIGVDPISLKVIPETPLAVSTLAKIGVVATVGLHQAGFAWHAAETLVQRTFMPAIEEPPAPDDLLPLGNLDRLLPALRQAGIWSAILTSDDRRATEASLPLLGLEGCIMSMVCGDDPIPSKPSPAGLHHLARTLSVPLDRMVMVGDSAADMHAGRNAGVAACIAVLSGTGRRADLQPLADVVLSDIGEISLPFPR